MIAEFFKAYDKYTTLALLPMLALPFVLDFFFSLQPPWPEGSTYITAFLELGVIFVGLFADIRGVNKLRRQQKLLIGSSILLFLVYFALYSLFVFHEPMSERAIIAGYECTVEARDYVAPLLNQSCPFLNDEALAAAGYQADKVWTPISIKLMEFCIFAFWSAFFVTMTYLFAITIAFASRKKMLEESKKSGK